MEINLTKQLLIEEYVVQGKSAPLLAAQYGIGVTSVYNALRRHEINRRPVGKSGSNLINYKFGEWTVVKKHPTRPATWVCKCSCGYERPVKSSNLLSGKSSKCSNCRKTGCGGRRLGWPDRRDFFADGHAEIKKWASATSIYPVTTAGFGTVSFDAAGKKDWEWYKERTGFTLWR